MRIRSSYATQASADSLARSVQRWLEDSDPGVLFKTCLTCNHSDGRSALCKKFNVVPPVSVIVGRDTCGHYSDAEEIPF